MWWLLPNVVLAGMGESLGRSGRLCSSYSPLLQTLYTVQYTFFPLQLFLTEIEYHLGLWQRL